MGEATGPTLTNRKSASVTGVSCAL